MEVNKETYNVGDFAEILPEDTDSKPYFCKVISISSRQKKFSIEKAAHVRWFARGENTIFGDLDIIHQLMKCCQPPSSCRRTHRHN